MLVAELSWIHDHSLWSTTVADLVLKIGQHYDNTTMAIQFICHMTLCIVGEAGRAIDQAKSESEGPLLSIGRRVEAEA